MPISDSSDRALDVVACGVKARYENAVATYVIGDVQGCVEPLRRLMQRIGFDRSQDHLALSGDLVNRGPSSLEVLRLLVELDDAVDAVLGNHDIYALARAFRVTGATRDDTLGALWPAPDRERLIGWLVRRPLLTELEGGVTMVHAGLLPRWSIDEARAEAELVRAELASDPAGLLSAYFNRRRPDWDPGLAPRERAVATLAVMTRIRFVDAAGRPCAGSGPPEDPPEPGLVPWFKAAGRKSVGTPIAFGHWASLGLWLEREVMALDSGCVWQGALTALRLEDRAVFSVPTRKDAD